MPVTKLKFFKVKISNDSKFMLDKTAQEKINLFLAEENNIYVNHSTSIITEDIREYGSSETINRFLVISLIYKDLNASEYDLKNTNEKIKQTVTKEIESGTSIGVPEIETKFDKVVSKLRKTVDNSAKKKTSPKGSGPTGGDNGGGGKRPI